MKHKIETHALPKTVALTLLPHEVRYTYFIKRVEAHGHNVTSFYYAGSGLEVTDWHDAVGFTDWREVKEMSNRHPQWKKMEIVSSPVVVPV